MDMLPAYAWAMRSQGLVAIALFAAMLVACTFGFGARAFVNRHVRRIAKEEEEPSGQEGTVVAEVLGLLSLLLAFTFGVALDRYEQRRNLVATEAAAIRSSYAVAQLLDEPHRTRISILLRAYVDNRIVLADSGGTQPRLLAINDQLLARIWAAVAAARDNALEHGVTEPFIEKTSAMLEHDMLRQLARRSRVPAGVLQVLFVYIVVTAAMLGYVMDGLRARIAAVILFGLLTLSIIVIVDLNRPMSGNIRESQMPMRMLRDYLRRQPPGTFDAFAAEPKRAPAPPGPAGGEGSRTGENAHR